MDERVSEVAPSRTHARSNRLLARRRSVLYSAEQNFHDVAQLQPSHFEVGALALRWQQFSSLRGCDSRHAGLPAIVGLKILRSGCVAVQCLNLTTHNDHQTTFAQRLCDVTMSSRASKSWNDLPFAELSCHSAKKQRRLVVERAPLACPPVGPANVRLHADHPERPKRRPRA